MNNAALLTHPEFADIDRHFAAFIGSFGDGSHTTFVAGLLSRNIRLGHICLDLNAGPAPFEEWPSDWRWPGLPEWKILCAKNRAFGGPNGTCPLVLDETGRLYLRRYWEYEKTLAEGILARCLGEVAPPPPTSDLQTVAVETALPHPFVVISGGPGTGKTTTVLRILERIVRQHKGAPLRIALAAPTGKAAARLQESLRAGKVDSASQGCLPTTASTLHRLLGARKCSVYFRHHARNPLPVDLVVVDEASMVPLPLMAKLFDALPKKARVILLGDRDQLASVEPGAVLGEIAEAAAAPGSPLRGRLIVLQRNYRFGEDSNIFKFGEAVRTGDADLARQILSSGGHPDLEAHTLPPAEGFRDILRTRVVAGYTRYLQAGCPAEAIKEFQKFRVLCALRRGPFGVERLNRQIEEILREEGLVVGPMGAFPGMPILITHNDYELRLFNGDIGILLPDSVDGRLVAWFTGEENSLRRIPPAHLPEHEPAFAMTVHKSQGSEFENVLFLLPDQESPVLTRELVYTGVTRARSKVEVWFDEGVLRAAVGRPTRRRSGLQDRLIAGSPSEDRA